MTNTNTATLLRSAGTRIVTPAELEVLPAPAPLGPRHRPIPHFDVVSALHEEADRRSLTIVREQWALAKEDARLFGILEFDRGNEIGGLEHRWSFGIRNSHDSSLALRGVAGDRTLVCDNLQLSGNVFVLSRKNTTHVRLARIIEGAYEKYLWEQRRVTAGWHALAAEGISDDRAKALIFDAFIEHKVAAVKYLPPVAEEYFSANADHPDTASRNRAGLLGSFTRVFNKIKSTNVRWASSSKVGKVFGV